MNAESTNNSALWTKGLLAVIGVAAVVKLVALFTGLYAVDGDEAIMGLMARHVLSGKGIPIFMYGQRYGAGAGPEALLTTAVMAVTSLNVGSVKIVALLIFGGFVVVTATVTNRIFGKTAALFAVASLSATPTLAFWFSKLRGGHFIALILLMLALRSAWGLMENKDYSKHGGYTGAFLLGLFAAAAALAQPLAAGPAGALVIFALVYKRRSMFTSLKLPALILGVLAVSIPVMLAMPEKSAWNPKTGMAEAFGTNRFITMTGKIPAFFRPYLDGIDISPPYWMVFVGWLWLVLSVICIIMVIKYAINGSGIERAKHALLVIPPLLAPLPALFLRLYFVAPRHFLASLPFLCMAMGVVFCSMANWKPTARIIGRTLMIAALLTGIIVQAKFIGKATIYGPGTQKLPMQASCVQRTIDKLEADGIEYIFCTDFMMQWNLMFESEEEIISRRMNSEDRYPPYVRMVNRAIKDGKEVPWVARLIRHTSRRRGVENFLNQRGIKFDTVCDEIYIIRYLPVKIKP